MKIINQEIADIAKSFIGQEEIRGNMGFKDERFLDLMIAAGWQQKQAWCIYFTEIVWKLAYANQNSLINIDLEKLFSGAATVTLRNFKKDTTFKISKTPVVGAIAIWQKYKDGKAHWTGHGAVVINFSDKTFTTVDGNTNDKGGREGFIVAKKTRKYNFESKSGLVLQGFIIPIEP